MTPAAAKSKTVVRAKAAKTDSRKAPGPKALASTYDVAALRREFPILSTKVHGLPLVYLDNAATTQKPRVVIEALRHYYEAENANIHRGVHLLSERATAAYEAARAKVAKFVGAQRPEEIVFTRGATEAINLVANTFARARLGKGDEVLVSEMEHHSNIVPWQMAAEATGATVKAIPMTDKGELDLSAYDRLFTKRTRMVAVGHVSNAIGTIQPVKSMVKTAHAHGVPVLVDGAQAVPHAQVDVKDLGADFYAASGHKMYGPTGIGFLYGRFEHLDAMGPWQGGGDMIRSVSFAGTTYNDVPARFEAGTPHIEGCIGLGAAVDFLQGIGMDRIAAHESKLLSKALDVLGDLNGVRIVGSPKHRAAVVSFTVDGVHPHDVGSLVDRDGVAIRTGHHCAQPIMEHYKLPATNRASFGLYNTEAEVDALGASVKKVVRLFA